MDNRFDIIDRWQWDNTNYCWTVKLTNEKIIKPGDRVLVKFTNGTFPGRVKQVAGFGNKEDRAVISVVFPGRTSGKKVYIDNVIDKL